MELFLLVLISLLQVASVFSADCFECYSKDYRICDQHMKAKSCPGKGRQCYSLRYYNEEEGEEEHGFKKGCVEENTSCQSIRQDYLDLDYKECKVSCCEGDLCNKNGFQELADQSKKSKRSSTDNSNNGVTNTSADHFYKKQTLIANLFCSFVFILYYSWS